MTVIVAQVKLTQDYPWVVACVDRWGTCFTAEKPHIPNEWSAPNFLQKEGEVAVYVGPTMHDVVLIGILVGFRCHTKLNGKEFRLTEQKMATVDFSATSGYTGKLHFKTEPLSLKRGDTIEFGAEILNVKALAW